jgi:uncharacterized protein (DUF608 family)
MAGGAAAGFGMNRRLLAMFEDGSIVVQDHRIPADKQLSREWLESLTARGTKEVWSGAELEAIGMPVGGIAAGQLYLKGDGTLGVWEIFNHHEFLSYGSNSYEKRPVPRMVDFGFAVKTGGKRRKLRQEDFPGVTFKGEYPTATTTYRMDDHPLMIEQTAYSPFIPLNAKDSALPATVFELQITNTSTSETVKFSLDGFLENAVARSADKEPGSRMRFSRPIDRGFQHSADRAEDPFAAPTQHERTPISLADFEGSTYGDWKVEGEAFGTGPAKGTLPNQQPVTGFEGKGLVNTFLRGDDTKGRLTSPNFTVDRRFINFKVGGGNHPGKACINLLVDGKVVRTSTGLNDERLMWDAWEVSDLAGKTAKIEIVDDVTGAWGHINVDSISQADTVPSPDDLKARRVDRNRDHGTMALVVLDELTTVAVPKEKYGFSKPQLGEIHLHEMTLRPGEKKTVTFVLAWHFPNHARGRDYANRFTDAAAVAAYVAKNYKRLSKDTKLWRDTFYKTTLPYWLLDRLASTNANLATGTTEWWGDGRFWAWEGVVCCAGTCTHVWNYEHGMARLFPELERNVRHRQDFGAGFEPATGLVGFRGNRDYAADGQSGTILKAYREHLTSKDDSFLKEHWSSIKKALLYLIGHDGNADGILEDSQPNTFDIDFFGPNTFIGSLYLGALRAGEEMAIEMGDADFAKMCRQIFEKGRDNTMAQLWNGEYFIQVVDEKAHKEYQYGPGCLSDQVFGQGWAHQVGLGHLYPARNVKTALDSVWKYNFSTNVSAYNAVWKPERPFAVENEAGLFICTWPKGGRQKDPVRYRDEVWTGIEYQVAGHMIWEGMVDEGLSICKAVHERYHPVKRNPYNEVECSDHYARAMASWGVFTALSGFEYHGPKGIIGFAPRVNHDQFVTAFTAAEGYGLYQQDRTSRSINVASGSLRLTQIKVPASQKSAKVTVGGKTLDASFKSEAGRLSIMLKEPAVLKKGQTLRIGLV